MQIPFQGRLLRRIASEAEPPLVHLPGQQLIRLWGCIEDRHFRLHSLVLLDALGSLVILASWFFPRGKDLTTCWLLIVLADGHVKYLNRYSLRFGLGSVAVGSAYSTYSENTNQQANP